MLCLKNQLQAHGCYGVLVEGSCHGAMIFLILDGVEVMTNLSNLADYVTAVLQGSVVSSSWGTALGFEDVGGSHLVASVTKMFPSMGMEVEAGPPQLVACALPGHSGQYYPHHPDNHLHLWNNSLLMN